MRPLENVGMRERFRRLQRNKDLRVRENSMGRFAPTTALARAATLKFLKAAPSVLRKRVRQVDGRPARGDEEFERVFRALKRELARFRPPFEALAITRELKQNGVLQSIVAKISNSAESRGERIRGQNRGSQKNSLAR
jgi:hypothetical protein